MVARTAARKVKAYTPPALPTRRCFTVDEYYRMTRAGIFGRDERTELLEGEIIQMPGIGELHAGGGSWLDTWLIVRLHQRAIVRSQNPVHLSERSEPVPDIAVLRLEPNFYRDVHPGPGDVYLLIEVSDTSLHYDRVRKLGVYAVAGIPEYWIVDLRGKRLLVFRGPSEGIYAETQIVERDGSIAPLAFPDLVLSLRELFP